MTKQIIHTDNAPKSLAGYSQGVKAAGLVFVAGQGPFVPTRRIRFCRNERRMGQMVSKRSACTSGSKASHQRKGNESFHRVDRGSIGLIKKISEVLNASEIS